QNVQHALGHSRRRAVVEAARDAFHRNRARRLTEVCAAPHPKANAKHSSGGASRHLLPATRLFDAHIFSLSFLTNSDSLQGQILEPMMDLSAVDVERYGVGGFGD